MDIQSTSEKKNWPKGVFVASFSEMWDRFIFYGLMTSLVLYLNQNFHFSDEKAYALWGGYIALGFALPVLGGLIADRYIGLRNAIFLGGAFIVIGCWFVCVASLLLLTIGLAFILLGIGFFKGTISAYYGTLFDSEPERKDQGFTLFFMGMTSGALLGPVVIGLMYKYLGWETAFLISSVGMLSSLCLFYFSTLKDVRVRQLRRQIPMNTKIGLTIGLSLLITLLVVLFHYTQFSNVLLACVIATTIVGLLVYAMRKTKEDAKNIIGIMIFGLLTVIFYAATLQVDGSLVLFVERYTQHSLFGWKIPSTTVSSIEPLFAFLTAPVLAKLWDYFQNRRNYNVSIEQKYIGGFLLAGIAFFIFTYATEFVASNYLVMMWLLVGNVILGFSASCIIPISMSVVSRFAPKNLVSTLMGFMFMVAALAGYVASFLGDLTDTKTNNNLVAGYVHCYVSVGMVSILTAVVVLCISRPLGKLLVK